MKKLILIAAGVLMPWLAHSEAKTVPYTSLLYEDADWTTINVEEASKTWQSYTSTSSYSFGSSGQTKGIYYTYDYNYAADDWYVSPAIHLEAGTAYKMKVWVNVGSGDNFKIMMASDKTAEALSTGTELFKLESPGYNSSDNKKFVIAVITPEQTGDYYFGMYEYSAKNKYTTYVTDFRITENVTIPGTPTSLTAKVGENDAIIVNLAWTLPTVDDDGTALTEAITAVQISRDGTVIATLDGTATSFQDTADFGLTGGFHEYSVAVAVGDNYGKAATVSTSYVGPVEPQALPWTADFSSSDSFTALWTTIKGESSAITDVWSYKASSYNGNSIQIYASGSGKVVDDWLISPPLKFEEAGIYKYTFKGYGPTSKAAYSVMLGDGKTIANFTQTIMAIDAFTASYSATEYEAFFEVKTPGTYYIGTHVNQQSTNYNTYALFAAQVEKTILVPAQVDDLAVAIDGNTIKLNWTNPSKNNAGTDLAALAKVEVYRDGTLLTTIDNPAVGEASEYIDESPANGINTYWVLAYTSEGAATGDVVKVASKWFGDPTQTLPYSYDFSDASLFGLYTVVDANNDGYTWEYDASAKRAKMTYDTTNGSNSSDYLITPPFQLEAGYYKVTYSNLGPDNGIITNGVVSDINDVTGTFSQKQDYKMAGKWSEKTVTNIFHITEAGKYNFAWYTKEALESSYANTLTIDNVKVEVYPVLPGLATDVTVTPDENQALSATIQWTNPTDTNIEGVAATDLTKVVVYRDGEEVTKIEEGITPGATMSFVDDTMTTPGTYTYKVEVYNASGKSETAATEVKSAWIGGGLDVPYEITNDNEYFKDWTIFNVNGDSNSTVGEITWTRNTFGSNVSITSNNTTPDDWIISPRINFVAKHLYDISLKTYVGYSGTAPYEWDLAYGSDVDPEAMTKLKTMTATENYATAATQEVITVRAIEPGMDDDGYLTIPAGINTIGFHAINKGTVTVANFSIKENALSSVSDVNVGKLYTVTSTAINFASAASSVIVSDLSGKMVISSADTQTVSTTGLTTGVYLFKAVVDGRKVIGKFVK